jgi:predicted peptidase
MISHSEKFLLVIGMLFFCVQVLAQNTQNTSTVVKQDPTERFEARIYKAKSGPDIPYRLLVPWNYDAAQIYPMVLELHGSGERGDDNRVQLGNGLSTLAEDKYRAEYPCFVLVPQCPEHGFWVSGVDFQNGLRVTSKKPAPELVNVMHILDGLRHEFKIDPDRIYITGLSMGGFGTWDALDYWPNLFAAAAPICGAGHPQDAKRFAKTPIWVWQGAADPVVPPARSEEMVEALKKAGGMPRFSEVPGVGHDVWWKAYNDPEFWQWLFAQRKGKN